ncbi:MAG: DUF2510 domain-containing protein [Actinomycetota bacterium]|nr:DUF2510 domain-containing protein [Actinomycetota bacterium]
MTDTSTAGWYPDPESRPGLERWWNGVGWSESIRPTSSSGTILTAQGRNSVITKYGTSYDTAMGVGANYWEQPAPSQAPWQGAPAQPEPADPARQGRVRSSPAAWGWLAGAVVLALVLAVVVFVGGSDRPGPPIATGGVPESPTRPPGQTRIVDEEAGVAYPYLGAYWLEFVNEVEETTSTAGQYIVTQEQTPEGQFIAQVTSGPLQALFGYAGPSSFAGTIAAVQGSVRTNYYPAPNQIETLRDEAVTVDGAEAYLLEFNLSWDVAGYDSTGERAALILIETGRPAPALVYISIPNTHAELYGIVDRVIAEIDVLN